MIRLDLAARETETDRLRRENETLRSRVGADEELTGNSPAINNVRATLKRVAVTGSRVLISGPAGAGKEVAARILHLWSARANGPFIVVSSARMEPEWVEEQRSEEHTSELQSLMRISYAVFCLKKKTQT